MSFHFIDTAFEYLIIIRTIWKGNDNALKKKKKTDGLLFLKHNQN